MAVERKEVAEQRYRESYGRYFEEFVVGDVYEHRPGRTLTEYDNISFTLLTMNTHPLHFDSHYASHSEFGKPLVNSALTLAIVAGMSVSDISQKAIANLGWNDIKLTAAPVFAPATPSMPNPRCSRQGNRAPAPRRASSRSRPPARSPTARFS